MVHLLHRNNQLLLKKPNRLQRLLKNKKNELNKKQLRPKGLKENWRRNKQRQSDFARRKKKKNAFLRSKDKKPYVSGRKKSVLKRKRDKKKKNSKD